MVYIITWRSIYEKYRVITLVLLFGLFFTGIKDVQAASIVQVHFSNIAQGDDTLIQTPNGNILIDGGGKGKGPEIIKYLNKYKVKFLTAMVSRHTDADHVGGLSYIINNKKVVKSIRQILVMQLKLIKDFY